MDPSWPHGSQSRRGVTRIHGSVSDWMSNSVVIAPKRLKLMRHGNQHILSHRWIWQHLPHGRAPQSRAALRSLVLKRVRAHTTTRHSRTSWPPLDADNADDRCFSLPASDDKSYLADKRWRRGSHTNRNTTKRCSDESNMNRSVLSPMTFTFERPLIWIWIGDAAPTIVNIRAVPQCTVGANGLRIPKHPCRMTGRSARTREGTSRAWQWSFRWSLRRFPSRSDLACAKAVQTTSTSAARYRPKFRYNSDPHAFSVGVRQPYVHGVVGPVAVGKVVQEDQSVDSARATSGEQQQRCVAESCWSKEWRVLGNSCWISDDLGNEALEAREVRAQHQRQGELDDASHLHVEAAEIWFVDRGDDVDLAEKTMGEPQVCAARSDAIPLSAPAYGAPLPSQLVRHLSSKVLFAKNSEFIGLRSSLRFAAVVRFTTWSWRSASRGWESHGAKRCDLWLAVLHR